MKKISGWDRRRKEYPLKRKCKKVGCSNVFEATGKASRKLYCSPGCRVTDFDRRKNGRRTRISQRYECPHGHEKTPDNVYHNPNGSLDCLTCRRFRGRESMRVRRGTLPENYRGTGADESEYRKIYLREVS